jgi:hypothetical protein
MFEFMQRFKTRTFRGKEIYEGEKIKVRVQSRPFGEPIIIYNCMACGSELKSPKSDIEKDDVCPVCEHEFTVPGSETYYLYFQMIRKEQIEKEKELSLKIANKLAENEAKIKLIEQKRIENELRQRERNLELKHRLDLESKNTKSTSSGNSDKSNGQKTVVNKQGNWCPNCKNRDSYKESDGKSCMIFVIIFISLGIGLILLPFLPKHWRCNICGNEWKA